MFLRSCPRWSGYIGLVRQEPLPLNIEAEPPQARAGHNSGSTAGITILSMANVALFALSFIMVIIATSSSVDKSLNAGLRATSSYTPIYDMLDLEPSIKRINGTVHATGHLSIARQFPNAEADAIWEDDIELIRPIPVTREQIIKMGKNPDTVAKLEDEVWGLGDNAYVAALDIFHNLHCLNTLRQAAYTGHYNQSVADANASDSPREIHLNHCVDILFQNIACSNNLNLVTRHWTEGREYPFPDFSIDKHCINFPMLTEWHKKASIDMKKYVTVMRKPEGVKEEPAAKLRSGL